MIDEASAISKEALGNLKATDQDMAIANSLESVAKSATATPAGILLLTDGIDNSSSQRAESILQDLGARGIPVYPIPVGLEEPDDVSIRNIVMQEVAFSGDRVPVRVQLFSGYEKRTAKLTVRLTTDKFATKTASDGGLQFENIDFNVISPRVQRVEIGIEAFDDEVSVANNRVERASSSSMRRNVLYIEGNNAGSSLPATSKRDLAKHHLYFLFGWA